MVTQAVVDSKK
jgi:hypothetical protein